MKTNTATKLESVPPCDNASPELKLVPCYACDGQGYFVSKDTKELVLCDCVTNLCSSCGAEEYLKKNRRIYNPETEKQTDCKCMSPAMRFNRIKKLYDKSNIPVKYKLAKYEDLDESHDKTPSLFAAKETIKEFLETSPVTNQKPLGFYMYGGTGCGKTHLAVSVLNVMILKYGIESRYCKYSRDFLQAIKDTFNKKNTWGDPDTESAKQIEDDLQKVPVLVLDDFGVTKESDWANEKTYDLLTTRLEANRITILTSNFDWDKFKGIFENRIYSRLCEMCRPVLFENGDYRELHKELC